jgi:hypothetical protein
MPKIIKVVFVFLLLSSGVCSHAQSFEQELREAVKTKPKLEFRMDSRHSFINQRGVKTAGVKVGIQFADKLSFGLGYNRLWSPLSSTIVQNGVETEVQLGFFNLSPYVEYVFYKDKKWELTIPVQIGFGSSYYSNQTESGKDKLREEFVMSYEPAITFQYRFLSYFGAGLGIGYRFMIVPNGKLEEKFTSPVYIFKTRIYFQDILRDLKID